ncbi:alpha/beta hydrolase [Nanoarchaeota archaeon]
MLVLHASQKKRSSAIDSTSALSKMPVEEITFENSAHHVLSGTLKYPDSPDPKRFPPVLVLHGFGSHSDHELISNLANFIYPFGYASLRFDFHGHGKSTGKRQEVHITQKIDDIISAISFVESHNLVIEKQVTLIGHAMGADTAILTAARDERIKCLVLLASRSDLSKHKAMFSPTDLEDMKKWGVCEHCQHGTISKDFLAHLDKYDIKEELKKINIPVIFINGDSDFQVPFQNAKELYFAANEPKRFEIIPDGDHWFRNPQSRQQLMDLIMNWVNRYIKQALTYESETTERLSRARLT